MENLKEDVSAQGFGSHRSEVYLWIKKLTERAKVKNTS